MPPPSTPGPSRFDPTLMPNATPGLNRQQVQRTPAKDKPPPSSGLEHGLTSALFDNQVPNLPGDSNVSAAPAPPGSGDGGDGDDDDTAELFGESPPGAADGNASDELAKDLDDALKQHSPRGDAPNESAGPTSAPDAAGAGAGVPNFTDPSSTLGTGVSDFQDPSFLDPGLFNLQGPSLAPGAGVPNSTDPSLAPATGVPDFTDPSFAVNFDEFLAQNENFAFESIDFDALLAGAAGGDAGNDAGGDTGADAADDFSVFFD